MFCQKSLRSDRRLQAYSAASCHNMLPQKLGFVERPQVPISKEPATWLVRDAEMTPGHEATVEPGTTGAVADPGHHSIKEGRIRWSYQVLEIHFY